MRILSNPRGRAPWLLLGLGAQLVAAPATASGAGATKFNVFVPANVMSSRPSHLVVTNVSSSATTVDIEDDGADGDTDDTVLGVRLERGASYALRIRDGAVNDDAGGKWDGDFFRVRADHPVVVMMGEASSWEHDWVPSEGKGSIGTSFFLFTLPTSGSPPDLDVFAYEDGTAVTVTDVSTNTMLGTGRATVDLAGGRLLLRATLGQGEDLNLRRGGLGLDALRSGRTYWVRATKPVTVLTGHLGSLSGGNQARDGGGFVPSANGSASGSLFFATIPHELGLAREKELRVVCPNPGSTLALFGANATSGGWTLLSQQTTTAAGQHFDFVGATDAAFRDHELYKIAVSPPYFGCTAFEANWMETGSPGTSDTASVVPADGGMNLGTRFSAYLGPPGITKSLVPVGERTNDAAPANGYASHLYVYGSKDGTSVRVRDLDTGGAVLDSTFTVGAEDYFHFVVDSAAYAAMTTAGRRPYVSVAASAPVTVVAGNFNDNWLTYLQSTLPPEPRATVDVTASRLACGETARVQVTCDNANGASLDGLEARLSLPRGLVTVDATATPVPPSAASGDLLWTAGTLAGGAARAFAVDVRLDCAALGCPTLDLASIRAECRGQAGGDTYASMASANVDLVASDLPRVESFTAEDVPYPADGSGPRVRVGYGLSGGSGAARVTVVRSVNDAAPTAAAAVLATAVVASDPSALAADDPYALHYEESRYYRLRVEDRGCVQEVGPLAVRTSSGQTGGLEGGLESNGRLATQIARRALDRSRVASWTELESTWRKVPMRPLETSGDAASALLPTEGPDGARRVDATPSDLPALTNARTVAAADYVDADSARVATLLVVETVGEVYEHSKALCDRAGGARIDGIEAHARSGEGALLRTFFRDERRGTGEAAVELKLYERTDGGFDAHARWLKDEYPAPAPGQRVLNVQAWSRRPGLELALAGMVLDGAKARVSGEVLAPRAHLAEAGTLGGRVSAELAGEVGTRYVVRTTRLTESAATARDEVTVSAGPLALEYPPFADVTVEVVDPASRAVLDRAWISDGAWSALDDGMHGGATALHELVTTGCAGPRAPLGTGDLPLSGCARLAADVRTYAGVARHLGGRFAPLALAPYAGVAFDLASSRPVRVCLEQPTAVADGQPCVDLAAAPERTHVVLPFAAFRGSRSCAPLLPRSLETLSIVARGQGALTVEAGSLTFLREAPATRASTVACTAPAASVPGTTPSADAPTADTPAASEAGPAASRAGTASGGCTSAPGEGSAPVGAAWVVALAVVVARFRRR